MKDNWEIKFIKPCRLPEDEHLQLTEEYINNCFRQNKIVQINLDNCSIQRMEMLPEKPTIKDVEEVGLLPLVNILQKYHVVLTAIGINEMPDIWVESSITAYEKFCENFWPQHQDDIFATQKKYDKFSGNKKVDFMNLNNSEKSVYGLHYVPMLQIQNIKTNHANLEPYKQFEIYLYSMIGFFNIINAFELEIAKYAFWEPSNKEINKLPEDLKQRRKDIKDNFAKKRNSIDKIKPYAFDATMDIHWLSGANYADELNLTININNKIYQIDNWVGTNDHKLYRINRDIHSVPNHLGQCMGILASVRDEYMNESEYWQNVDELSKNVLIYRNTNNLSNAPDNLVDSINSAVNYIEKELNKD